MQRGILHLRDKLGAGLVAIAPITITVLVMQAIYGFVTDRIDPLLNPLSDYATWLSGTARSVLAIFAVLAVIYVLGHLVSNVLGRRLIRQAESVLGRVPFVSTMYRTLRQATDALSNMNKTSYLGVVLLEFPRPGVLGLGFVTSSYFVSQNERYLAVYIPTIPNPTSGFLAIVKEDQLTHTDLTVEEGMRIVISGGVLAEEVTTKRFGDTGNAAEENGTPQGQ